MNPRSIGLRHFEHAGAGGLRSRSVAPVAAGSTCAPHSGQKPASAGMCCWQIAQFMI
jgi:hypothetical protein